ncbi:NAD(P)H-binding protein [Spirillospora sp. NPDC048911]|uniref:NAD(P)H-binding protein n=1 Tax=Spirillospora sp. NPDC048911 TaxID=3364527 RepID=UPI00371B2F43
MILVTGATGIVGRGVVKLLLEAGEGVTAVSRSPETAGLPEGATVVSQTTELAGVDAMLIAPRAVGETTGELLTAAAAQGVKRVVLLSAVTVEYGGGYERFAAAFKAAEKAVEASGLEWTFLRCADFAANNLAWAPQIRATGAVRGAYGDAATSSIHERDIAEVAVRALLDPSHAGRAYALTGPESLSQHDKVRLIGEAIGTGLTFTEVPPEQVRAAMLAQGMPEDVPDRMLGYLATCSEQPGPSTDTVARVLGRPALSYADWAADHAADFGGGLS